MTAELINHRRIVQAARMERAALAASYGWPQEGAGMICDCGTQATYTTNEVVYGWSYGGWPYIWLCPNCGSYVGCHKGTDKPLGTLADAATRRARRQAHAAFDPLWQGGAMTRTAAYTWLAEQMGIEPQKCHIGMFTAAQCEQVIEIMQRSSTQEADK